MSRPIEVGTHRRWQWTTLRARLVGHSIAQKTRRISAARGHRGPGTNLNPQRQDIPLSAPTGTPLREHVATAVQRYLHDLDGCHASDLYPVVLRELEIPLFVEVLKYCSGNQSRAAAMLGIHRATLRKKLREYGLD